MKESRHRVGGGVGVVLVISQYLGLGCFSTAGWPRQQRTWATLSLFKEPWRPVFPFTILFAIFTMSSAWGYATEFVWGTICLEQLSTDGHQFECGGVTWF